MKRLDEIFSICYGSQLDLNKCEVCGVGEGYNFVNRSNSNCGVSSRILRVEKKEPFKAGCITVAMGGSVLSSFVQQEDFYTGQNVKVLVPLEEMTLSEKLFYCQCIEANRFRFSTFGREANYSFDSLLVPSREEVPQKIKKANIDLSFDSKPLYQKKLSLKTDKWKWFELHKLFSKERGTRLTKPDREAGSIPLITAGCENEGVADYISNNDMKIFKNAITIDMFGFSCYRGFDFCCDDNILVLKSSKMNIFSGLFIASVINKDGYKCAYGRQYRQKTFNVHKIKLPALKIAPNEYEPDWQFMEDYIKSLPYSSCL